MAGGPVEPPELGDDFRPETPDYLSGHDSVWNAATAAELGGATSQERDIFAQQMYSAYVDRNLSSDERSQARMDAEAAMDFWGVGFDWAEWRREMGYDKS